MEGTLMNNGVFLRWINTAGFELITADQKHILVDPFLSGTVNGIRCYPMELSEIQQCDYLILSHIHVDHAGDVAEIQKKFPHLKLFVGDLSADPLCQWQNIDCSHMYRVRPGERFEFNGLSIDVFSGRHTESSRGYYRKKYIDKQTGKLKLDDWFGNLELNNYLLTLIDGTRLFFWAGMTSEDQIYRFKGLNPDIAFMHVSPKQSFEEFSNLVKAVKPRVIIPHHYDFTEAFFDAVPEAMNDISEENKKNFMIDGKFNFERYMEELENACRQKTPTVSLLKPEHHVWYQFGVFWKHLK